MDRRMFLKTVPAIAALASVKSSFAADVNSLTSPVLNTKAVPASVPLNLSPIELVKPDTDGGKSVMAALWERKSNRNVSDKKLSPQELSNLLWAAFGVNRPAGSSGRVGRTAATASDSQEIDLYVVLPEGIYLYEAVGHKLTPVAEGDHRGTVGRRQGGRMATAPVILVFVADIAKYSQARFQEPGLKDPEIQKSYYNVATGLISGNVYLFAASQGLATWFHNCNKTALAEVIKPRSEQRILYAQTVGYPA
jgi:hypothetical protein